VNRGKRSGHLFTALIDSGPDEVCVLTLDQTATAQAYGSGMPDFHTSQNRTYQRDLGTFRIPVLAGFNESFSFAEDRAVDEVTFCCSGVVEEIASHRLGLSGAC